MAIVPRRLPPAASPEPFIVARARTRPSVRPAPADVEPATPDYDVGYAKPPKHSRFKPGQSGNPKGRPKGAKGLKTIVRAMLTEKVKVRTATGMKKLAKIEAVLLKVTERAFDGDMRALHLLLQYYQQSVPESVPTVSAPASPAAVDDHDNAILDEMMAMLLAEREKKS